VARSGDRATPPDRRSPARPLETCGRGERTCGVWVIDIRSGRTVAFLRFEAAVQEIFAILVLPGMRFPALLTDDQDIIASSFILPDEHLADVPHSRTAA
jgi:hypothetical protein